MKKEEIRAYKLARQCQDCLNLKKELRRYKKAYNLFMDYFDYLPDEDKEGVSKKLEKLNL